MSVEFYDRLTHRSTPNPEETAFLGQYRIASDDPIQLNGLEAKSGDYLVPDQRGSGWTASWAAGVRHRSGKFRCDQPLLQREYHSLLALGQLLEERVGRQPSWENWLRVSPLVPNVGEIAELNECDRAIAQFLPHLQEVCRHPSVRLKEAIERLPVSRARRVAPRATEYLAAHPEDWQHRKLRSVVPKRLRAVIYDDEVDIYENRVAARLVEELDKHLRDRIGELRKILEELRKHRAEHHAPTLGTNWRNDRVYDLFAEGIGYEVEHPIEASLMKLRALHHDVRMLFDSPVYTAIPHQARSRVPSTLRSTNIFVNDRHYRHVAVLWREIVQPSGTAADYYDKMQRLCRGFDLFCVLLVCRAFEQFGFTNASSGARLEPGEVLVLQGPGDESVELAWKHDFTLAVKIEEEEHIRFIPLVSPLSAASAENVESSLHALVPPQASGDQRVGFGRPQRIILYPGDSSQREALPTNLRLRIQSIGNDLRAPASIGLVPVSTYEVDSVERVARVLQWRLVGRRMLSYPPETWIPVSFGNDLLAVAPWLGAVEGRKNTARVLRFPLSHEDRALSQLLDAESQRYSRQGRDGKHGVKQLERFRSELQSAYADLKQLLRCPVCQQTVREHRLRWRGEDSFECFCENCESSWRTDTCGKCGEPYPVLEVATVPRNTRPRRAGWVNQVLGRDVLAVPCWLPGSEGSYICPWCGACRNRDRADSDGCPRCTAQPSAWS